MRPRFAGGGFTASVASLALGIFLLDRGTRTAKAKNAIKEMGAFFDATTKRIFEESGKASL